jgi:hypothetical protein
VRAPWIDTEPPQLTQFTAEALVARVRELRPDYALVLALKVSYVNVLAELCERMGADITEVSRTMDLDARIGHAFLSPGPGWGGWSSRRTRTP